MNALDAQKFYYKHRAGDRYRILSTVSQDVFINRRLSHRSEIINRIAVEITSAAGSTGDYKAIFQTAEKVSSGYNLFEWSREYLSHFSRNHLGYIIIDDEYFMPMVRDAPVFPDMELLPGETWRADGCEVHDFRDSFGIEKPFIIPFTADYKFLGTRKWKGKDYPAFSVSYMISHEFPAARGIQPGRIQGSSDQIVYWDSGMGQAAAYEETFRMILYLSNGTVAEFRGRAEAEIIEAPVMDKQIIAEEIREHIKQMDIQGTSVRIEDDGVTISLENIQFLPDSAILRNDEKLKLDKIIEILRNYPERDIQVSGHTALAGTMEGRDQLSLERAAGVARYLLEKNLREEDRLIIMGYGAERPLADNDTEQGRERNRRVEITILEN